MRGLVACGWFGIQTWVGAQSLHKLCDVFLGAAMSGSDFWSGTIGWLGINLSELVCFVAFWALQVGIILSGIESIRVLEEWSAPVCPLRCAPRGMLRADGPCRAVPRC